MIINKGVMTYEFLLHADSMQLGKWWWGWRSKNKKTGKVNGYGDFTRTKKSAMLEIEKAKRWFLEGKS